MNAEEVKRLLPWYAVDALDEEERRAVEAELARSPDLRRELAEVHVLRDTVQAADVQEPVFRDSLLDDALGRIDELERARSQPRPRASVTVLERFRRNVASDWRAASGVTRFALAAQFALIFVLASFLLAPGRESAPRMEDATGLTATGTEPVVGDEGPQFTVRFAPEATIGQIGEFLDAQGLRIVSGPSPGQSYIVQLADESVNVAVALEKMRAMPQLVQYAAPVAQ